MVEGSFGPCETGYSAGGGNRVGFLGAGAWDRLGMGLATCRSRGWRGARGGSPFIKDAKMLSANMPEQCLQNFMVFLRVPVLSPIKVPSGAINV